MASAYVRAGLATLCVGSWLSRIVVAQPTVAFPFNSQVPTVARVNDPYHFTLSPATFTSADASSFVYSLSQQPPWLSIDSNTLALSGTPGPTDVGSITFVLTAADSAGAANMVCTMIVSAALPPIIPQTVVQQLASSVNLSSSQPAVITLLPMSTFSFGVQRSSFSDSLAPTLYFYATLVNHTPLPSWMAFDPSSVTFSGTAPQLSAFPQSWDVDLIVSDVAGFAGSVFTFTVSIGTQQLVFVPEQVQINIAGGMDIRYSLASHLYLNGKSVAPSDLQTVQTKTLPSWLAFDQTTLVLSGTVPSIAQNESVVVTFTNTDGDSAMAVVNLVATSIFTGAIGNLTAYPGQHFRYHLSESLFSVPVSNVIITLPSTARWLSFDSQTRTLEGTVPTRAAGNVTATITARSSDAPSESQTFTIYVRSATSTQSAASETSSTISATSVPTESAERSSHSKIGGAVIAAIVLGLAIASALLLVGMCWCLRRRRKRELAKSTDEHEKSGQPRPLRPQLDIENRGRDPPNRPDPAPRLELNLPWRPDGRRSRWMGRFSRSSHQSSIGPGQSIITADNNVPEWDQPATALDAPHDSFAIAAEIARRSKLNPDRSPGKSASRHGRGRRASRQSIGLGIDRENIGPFPRHSSRGSRYHSYMSGGLSRPASRVDRGSLASVSTRGTSLLSTVPSDFPPPPSRSTWDDRRSKTRSVGESDTRKSIRLVDRSDSNNTDRRSLADRRQSFIRNRASSSYHTPLFTHMSRATSRSTNRPAAHHSRGPTSVSSGGSRPPHISQLATPLESLASLPSQGTSAASDSRRFSVRLRSAFAPNFPRPVAHVPALDVPEEGASDGAVPRSSSEYYTTSSSVTEADLVAQLSLPRHKRSWVLPGEASPTPPPLSIMKAGDAGKITDTTPQPAPSSRRTPSSLRQSSGASGVSASQWTSMTAAERARLRWRARRRNDLSSSPLSRRSAPAQPAPLPGLPTRKYLRPLDARKQGPGNRLGEPMALVNSDSLSRARSEQEFSGPDGNEGGLGGGAEHWRDAQAEDGKGDARAGSEMWEAIDGAGLMPANPAAEGDGIAGSQRSDVSGPAFL